MRSGDFEKAGWVQCKPLIGMLKIPSESTFYNLIESLVEKNLVEKKIEQSPKVQRGKTPVYYRVPSILTRNTIRTFEPKEKLIIELKEADKKIETIELQLAAAKNILRRCHDNGYDPGNAILEEISTIPPGEEFWYVNGPDY
jgi:hypothetical protein